MTRNPIHKVLSTLRSHRVHFLLMGGQACILYGAAEFSRDTDIALLANPANLVRLKRALLELQAERIAVPPLSLAFLRKGHAVHFRCHHPDAAGMRIDIMSVMRGLPLFGTLWRRRTTVEVDAGRKFDVMSLPDLVRAKKTQRDKDWLMLRRLVEAHHAQNRSRPEPGRVEFWLKEAQTAELLIGLSRRYPSQAKRLSKVRPLLVLACRGQAAELEAALYAEREHERETDRRYWDPLKREIERLRHRHVRNRLAKTRRS